MTNPIKISSKDARRLVLSGQGLDGTRQTTMEAIRQLSYVQIDTISVTERSHNHVLFTRNPKYKPQELLNLMDGRSIFEYWSHAAAYLPMEDYRFSLYKKEAHKNGDIHWFERDKKAERYVMDRIKAEGPLQSKDFETPKDLNTDWYEWKPTKIALSNLFMEGSLMIANRKGFHKIYDLTGRVLPSSVDTTTPTETEYFRHLVQRAIQSHGLVTPEEIGYLRKGIKPAVKQVVSEMLEEGEIIAVGVHGNANTYYSTPEMLEVLNSPPKKIKTVHILNPFDNLLIQRKRVKTLFDFEYIIECYVPEKKRVYGYYTLSVLYGDKFVMRFDAKAHRKTGVFTVNGYWYEKGFKPSQAFSNAFNKKLEGFAKFCGCHTVEIPNTKFQAPISNFPITNNE